jgi:phosphoglycerol transferase MdoB-like AlkP superfamily enzyme
MFTQGQLIFALLFLISFIAVMVFSYRKDLKLHKQYYKGSFWILMVFLLFICALFLIKKMMKE